MSKYSNFYEDKARHNQICENIGFQCSAESQASEFEIEDLEAGEWSSSSSLGWSDEFSEEYDNSIRNKVYKELLLMNKVLKGEITLPSHYDKDEYNQWMKRFPGLSILDSYETPVNSPCFLFRHESENPIKTQKLIRKSCDIVRSQNHSNGKKSINNFDSTLDGVKSSQRFPKVDHMKIKNSDILDSENSLRIHGMKSNMNRRKLSAKSMLYKQVPPLNIPTEYKSLPFIKIDHVSTRKLSSDFVNKKAWKISPRSLDCEDSLVLPPITMKNNFRSISATPRQYNKTFSALSTKSNLLSALTEN